MDWLKQLITNQWQRKVVALISALVIWFVVSHSIIDEKTIPNVPIRVINLPEDKTIPGMQTNGIIGKRIPLTLSGSRDAIHALEAGDIEILLDASAVQQNDWVVQVTKKNLVSLNPSIDLNRHISEISHPEFVLKISNLMSAKIPVRVLPPKGSAPPGYEYLDIWPQQLVHLVVGPEESVQKLLHDGIDLQIDMNMISKADLDKIASSRENFHDDEVSFFIPSHWKKIALPFKGGIVEEINDPESQNLHIDFLRKEAFSLSEKVVVRAFYPIETANAINPQTTPLLTDDIVKSDHGIVFYNGPLYVRDISPLFLEVIQKNLEIVILADHTKAGSPLHWSLQVVDPHLLEDAYVKALVAQSAGNLAKSNEPRHTKKRESHLRQRFREYLQKLHLYTDPDHKLKLDVRLMKDGISVIPGTY